MGPAEAHPADALWEAKAAGAATLVREGGGHDEGWQDEPQELARRSHGPCGITPRVIDSGEVDAIDEAGEVEEHNVEHIERKVLRQIAARFVAAGHENQEGSG